MSALLLAAAPSSFGFTALQRLSRRLRQVLQRGRYRPERHYMRGGRTAGSRSQARERLIQGG